MIGFQHTDLPDGLNALALPPRDGGAVLLLSTSLDPAEQRAAAISAIRAARRAGWIRPHHQMTLLVPIAAASVRHGVAGLLAHLTTAKGIAVTAASAAVAGLAAVAVAVTPVINLHIIPVRPAAPHTARLLPASDHAAGRGPQHAAQVTRTGTKTAPHPTVLGSGSAAPTTSSAPSPSASASVSVSPSPTEACPVNLLGIPVCL